MTTTPVKFTAPYDEVERVANLVIGEIEEEELGVGLLALTLAMGRLLSVTEMNKINEVDFVASVLDFAGTYVAAQEGLAN